MVVIDNDVGVGGEFIHTIYLVEGGCRKQVEVVGPEAMLAIPSMERGNGVGIT